jgi:hypothetical protein
MKRILILILAIYCIASYVHAAIVTPGYDFYTDASLDTDGNARWEDLTTGNPSGFEFQLDDSPAVTRVASGSAYSGITHAYNFQGGSTGNEAGALLSLTGTAGAARSFLNAPGNWTDEDVTIEIWFKPDNLTPTPSNGQIIFEEGGLNGFGFFIDNNELRLRKTTGGLDVGYDISEISGEYIHAVGTYDMATGIEELFVNGISRAASGGGTGSWSGGDSAAVGTRGGGYTGGLGRGQQNTESFDGQVAIVRLYRNQILNDTEVLNNFEAIPEPATLGLMGFSTLGLLFRRRKMARCMLTGTTSRRDPFELAATKKAEKPSGYVNTIKPLVSSKALDRAQWLNY